MLISRRRQGYFDPLNITRILLTLDVSWSHDIDSMCTTASKCIGLLYHKHTESPSFCESVAENQTRYTHMEVEATSACMLAVAIT